MARSKKHKLFTKKLYLREKLWKKLVGQWRSEGKTFDPKIAWIKVLNDLP